MSTAPLAAIIGIAGPLPTDAETALIRGCPPLGIILFRRNVVSPMQLADLTGRLREILPAGAVLMVDQEGGRVARLRSPHWREHPPAAAIGRLHARDPEAGLRAACLTGALIGLDCAAAGFDVVCAPVLDRSVAGADAIVGDRAFGEDAGVIVPLASAFAEGLLAAGVQPVGKHAPGHGRATLDSHLILPEIDAIDEADLAPFAALRWLPWLMTAHILYRGDDPARPATLSPRILREIVRGRLGFDNLLVSDDLAMHALTGAAGDRAALALQAGCDVALHCSGVLEESRDVLARVSPLSETARLRLGRARALAAGRRIPLDPEALAFERERLLC
jgi:beta-N-acetylhexosaminidase